MLQRAHSSGTSFAAEGAAASTVDDHQTKAAPAVKRPFQIRLSPSQKSGSVRVSECRNQAAPLVSDQRSHRHHPTVGADTPSTPASTQFRREAGREAERSQHARPSQHGSRCRICCSASAACPDPRNESAQLQIARRFAPSRCQARDHPTASSAARLRTHGERRARSTCADSIAARELTVTDERSTQRRRALYVSSTCASFSLSGIFLSSITFLPATSAT